MTTLREMRISMIRFFTLLFCFAPFCLHARGDFRPFVEDALRRGERKIVIPPGNYRIAPKGNGGELWVLAGVKDVEIIADGVTMTGTKLMRALGLYRCSNLTIRGLVVDYDPLPFTQGEIIAAADDGGSIDVKIHAGYPKKPYARIDIIDPKTRFRKQRMPFLWGTKGEMISEDVVRVKLPGIGKFARPGDLASLSTGQEAGAPHGISIDQCERIHFDHVTIHSAPGMGILEADGEGGSTFTHCRIIPGPMPAGATEERLLSSSWDAFQSKTIRKGPLIENCEITHAGDDSWSVQSSDFVVLKNDNAVVTIASRDEHTVGLQNGDRVRAGMEAPEFLITSRKVVSRKDAGLTPEVMEKLESAKTWDSWKASPRCLVLTLDRAVDWKPGDSIYSPDRMGSGFVFRNNRIHSPGRILLKAGGLMENNTLEWPHALIVCPEIPGSSATGIENLIIRKNTIVEGGWFCAAPWSSQAGVISLTATGEKDKLRDVPVFKNVVIEDNVIRGGIGPQLVASSVKGLKVAGNRFVRPQHDKPESTGASYSIPKDVVVWISKCADVKYDGNKIEDAGEFARVPEMIE
jgi:hypothetical protein